MIRSGPQHDLLVQPSRQDAPVTDTPSAPIAQEGAASLVQRAQRAPTSLSPGAIKSLHRATGSRAAQAILAQRAPTSSASGSPAVGPSAPQSASAGFALQTQLEVGPAGDRYEREADRVAASVVRQIQTQRAVKRSPNPAAQNPQDKPQNKDNSLAQRAEQLPDTEIRLDASSGAGLSGGPVDSSTEQSIQKARGGGQPLSPKVRGSMEGAFNANFSGVRVHTNSKANSLNTSLNARAFTTGQDLFFKKGAYNPGSSDGQKLIAHELTHVVQQNGSGVSRQPIQRVSNKVIQRALQFDSSWDGYQISSWVGYYDKGTEQAKLKTPYRRLKGLMSEIKSRGYNFEAEENKSKWRLLRQNVSALEKKKITYAERETVLGTINTYLISANQLRIAPLQQAPISPMGSISQSSPKESFSLPSSNSPMKQVKSPPKKTGVSLPKSLESTPSSELGHMDLSEFISSQLKYQPFSGKYKHSHNLIGDSILGPSIMDSSPRGLDHLYGRKHIMDFPGFDFPRYDEEGFRIPPKFQGKIPPVKSLSESSESLPKPEIEHDLEELPDLISDDEVESVSKEPTKNDVQKAMPENVKEESGKWILSLPNISGKPAVEAEVVDFKLNAYDKSELKLVNTKLHWPTNEGMLGESVKTYDVPVEVHATFSADEGLSADIILNKPQDVGKMFKIKKVVGHYRKGSFSMNGQVGVNLPGLKPFETNLEYLGELDGYGMTASRIQFNLPDLGGAPTKGYIDKLEYTTRYGGFQGQGFLEGNLPVLGKTTAIITMNRNKLNGASVRFLKAAFPSGDPIITGAGDGKIDFDEYNQFLKAEFSGDFNLALRNDDDKTPPTRLTGGAFIKGGKFGAGLKMHSDLPINEYIKLNKFSVDVGPDGKVVTEGSFGITKIKDAPDIPLESQGKELAPVPQKADSLRSDMLHASLDYGYDFTRGFWVNGEISVPLDKKVDQGMLSGRLNYSKGALNAELEVGDAVLISQKDFTHELYKYHNTFALSPWGKVKGLSKLGGIFGEVDARLEFKYTLGPVTVDAHGRLRNIDLINLKADVDPFVVEEVRGGAQAALQGTPYLGLAAWFASEEFATVRGGLAFPVTAVLGTEAILRTKEMKLINGKFTGSDVKVDLPLAFGLNAAVQPNLEVYALRGLINKQFPFKELAKTELMTPRLLLGSSDGTDLNVLRKTYSGVNRPYLPADLEGAPKTTQDLVMKGSAGDIAQPRRMDPRAKPSSNPDSYTIMPNGPMDLKKLVGGMVGDDNLKMVTDVINAIEALAERFKLGEKLNDVIKWLDDWGLLAPLMRGGEALTKLVEIIESGVDVTLSKLWDLFGIEHKDAPDPSSEDEPPKNFKDVVESGMRPQRVVLALGPSRVWVMTPVAPGEQTAVEVEKNRVKESGLDLDVEKPKLTFDDQGKVTGGRFFATIKAGKFGTLTKVILPVNAEAKMPVIQQDFENADFDPSHEHLPGVEAEKMTGSFTNTQVRLTKVALNKHAQVTMPNPLPMMGGMDLKTEQPPLMAFEEQNGEWMIMGRGISFGDGSYVTMRVLEYAKNEKGVTAKGELVAKINGIGNARAEFSAVEDKFTKLLLTVNSEMVQYPKTDPLLSGQLAGTITINAKAVEKAAVGGTLRLQHATVNNGEPVDVQGNLEFTPELEPKLLSTTIAKPVSLVKGIANLSKLNAKYDYVKEEADFESEGDLELMGTKVGLEALYKKQNFRLKLSSESLNASIFSIKQLAIAHVPKAGWSMGGRAEVTGMKGFEHVAADIFYRPNRIGFAVGDKVGMPKDVVSMKGETVTPNDVKVAQMPGAKLHAVMAYLEYDLARKQFDGKGELGLTIPVMEGNTITGAGAFTIERNALSSLDVLIATHMNLPASKPIVSGPVRGTIKGENGRLGGDIKGDLDINNGQEGAKILKPKGEKDKDTSNVKFLLSVDHDSGITGFVKQTGTAKFGGIFKLKGLDIQITSALNVQDTIKGIDSLGGSPSKNLKEVSSLIARSGIARDTTVVGKGQIKAGGKGSAVSGGLQLNYGKGGFQKSTAEISLGQPTDKNGKPGIYGTLTGEYTPEAGFALTKGSLTANITKGLQAEGTLGRREGDDLDAGLDASLMVKAKLMDGAKMYNKKLFEASVQPTIPIIPGLFSIYGDAGVELSLKYGLKPFLLTGQANVMGINLADRTFEKAFVNIKKEPSTESKPTGDASVEFMGKPYFGIGAAIATPKLAGVSGGLKFPISAKASVDPVLDTNVIYDEEGKLKGNFKMGFPLVLRVKMGVLPYVKGTALGGLIDLNWDPGKPLEEVDLMEPKQVSMINLDLGKLDEEDGGAEKLAPGDASELKPASPQQAEKQKTPAKPKMSGSIKGAGKKVGEVPEPKEGEEAPSAPIGFAGVKSVFAKGFAHIVKTAKSVYDKVAMVAGKLGELVSMGAEKLGTTAKNVVKSIAEVGSWIKSWFGGNPDKALEEVQKSEDLIQVDNVEKFPLFRSHWSSYYQFKLQSYEYSSPMGKYYGRYSGLSNMSRIRSQERDFDIDFEPESSPFLGSFGMPKSFPQYSTILD